MRFLADHDVYAVTSRLLVAEGHDVVRVADLGLAQASDSEILSRSQQERRILLTCDRDYGRLVYVGGANAGVIYLRINPASAGAVHQELLRVLGLYSENELLVVFVVVEPTRHRIRRP
jgi:predicted nuclease of predicted toxin-antitoxin system